MIQNSFKIINSEEAQQDILETVKWHNKQKKGLGKKIKEDVKNTEILITENPAFAFVMYNNIKTAARKVFIRVAL